MVNKFNINLLHVPQPMQRREKNVIKKLDRQCSIYTAHIKLLYCKYCSASYSCYLSVTYCVFGNNTISVANNNFAKLRRKYLSNRSARSKPIKIRVADLSSNRGAPVFRRSKEAQLCGLAVVLATLNWMLNLYFDVAHFPIMLLFNNLTLWFLPFSY